MINLNKSYFNAKQAVLPILISDYLDICDPVLTFDRFMEEMDLEQYLNKIPKHFTGRLRYNPVSMLKTVLFGFMTNGYIRTVREMRPAVRRKWLFALVDTEQEADDYMDIAFSLCAAYERQGYLEGIKVAHQTDGGADGGIDLEFFIG